MIETAAYTPRNGVLIALSRYMVALLGAVGESGSGAACGGGVVHLLDGETVNGIVGGGIHDVCGVFPDTAISIANGLGVYRDREEDCVACLCLERRGKAS